MASLKKAMAWDEKVFGREYDLDLFMIVAVSDFNFGAMENKGLNIFNTKYILAKPQTATDADDTNQPGYTTFQAWTIVEGNSGSVFRIKPSTGAVEVARPLNIDWRKSSYTLLTTVSDGANTSTPVALTVNIPKKVTMCLIGLQLEAPKATAPLLLWVGAGLGPCKAPR